MFLNLFCDSRLVSRVCMEGGCVHSEPEEGPTV